VTDGAVTDEQLTKNALNYANTAPLSIVIVGVGNDDFSKMKFLDIAHQSNSGMHDIVKFVEFNRFRNDREGLILETLSEIPQQVVQYFQDKGIQPLPPVSGDMDDMSAKSYSSMDDQELDFLFGEDGTVQLANVNQAIWDPQQYGNANTFMTRPTASMDQQPITGTITGNRTAPDGYSSSPSQDSYFASAYRSVSPIPNGYSSSITLSPGREKPKLTPYV
jgi:Copine